MPFIGLRIPDPTDSAGAAAPPRLQEEAGCPGAHDRMEGSAMVRQPRGLRADFHTAPFSTNALAGEMAARLDHRVGIIADLGLNRGARR